MPRQFDPRRHVEYLPPEFTQGQKMMYPEDDGDYYFDDEWYYIGDFDVDDGWYISKDYVKAYFMNGSEDVEVWNYK